MAKVWNITDNPGTSCASRVMLVMGRSIRPGSCVNIPDDLLANAKKVQRAVLAGKLFIGPKLPGVYSQAKIPVAASLPKGAKRAHGLSESGIEPVFTSVVPAKAVAMVAVKEKEEVATYYDEYAEPSTGYDSGSKGKKKTNRS